MSVRLTKKQTGTWRFKVRNIVEASNGMVLILNHYEIETLASIAEKLTKPEYLLTCQQMLFLRGLLDRLNEINTKKLAGV